jgi:hypothetical protein
MANLTTTYSFINVAVSVDGRPVEGLWEGDDAITIERNSDNAEPLVGVDGTATVSISADDSATVTVRLQPNSPANQVLQNKYLQNRSGRAAPFPISIRDTGSGEGGSSGYGIVTKRPDVSLGGTATVREWVIFVNPWTETPIQYGAQ